MSRTVDLSISVRARQYIVAGFFTACLSPLVGVVAVGAGLPSILAILASIVCWVTLTETWARRLGGDGESSSWGGIPQSQYLGRLAGGGGIVKKEQEDALGKSNDDQ